MGIIVPLVIGFLIRGGNFAPALAFVSAMALISAFSYLVIIGKVERVR